MIQPPARFGEGESAGRRPGGAAAETGKAPFPPPWGGGQRPAPAARPNPPIPPKLNQPPPLARGRNCYVNCQLNKYFS